RLGSGEGRQEGRLGVGDAERVDGGAFSHRGRLTGELGVHLSLDRSELRLGALHGAPRRRRDGAVRRCGAENQPKPDDRPHPHVPPPIRPLCRSSRSSPIRHAPFSPISPSSSSCLAGPDAYHTTSSLAWLSRTGSLHRRNGSALASRETRTTATRRAMTMTST